ncbi:MAG: response regulator [Paenibacillaceae bacterium]
MSNNVDRLADKSGEMIVNESREGYDMSYKILVVDDTSFMRKMAADCLKQYGHIVIGEAINGRDGIQKYKELQPDIVMMDLNMPEMSGIEAIKEILQINPEAIILVCSASNQQDEIEDALEAGARGYLSKPFNSDHLNDAILKYAEPRMQDQESTKSHVSLEPETSTEEALAINTQKITIMENGESAMEVNHNAKEVDRLNSNKENRAKFVTSYMCNWIEEINDEATIYSVICSEKEDKILIEMDDDNHEKQVIRFTFDSFRQLNEWLENHLGNNIA